MGLPHQVPSCAFVAALNKEGELVTKLLEKYRKGTKPTLDHSSPMTITFYFFPVRLLKLVSYIPFGWDFQPDGVLVCAGLNAMSLGRGPRNVMVCLCWADSFFRLTACALHKKRKYFSCIEIKFSWLIFRMRNLKCFQCMHYYSW